MSRTIYIKLYEGKPKVYNYSVNMSNDTRFEVELVVYNEHKIGISIDRMSHFIFKNIYFPLSDNFSNYLKEKLFLRDSDAGPFIRFLNFFYKEHIECKKDL